MLSIDTLTYYMRSRVRDYDESVLTYDIILMFELR